ncbi:MAG: pentapeptide repeat-containing protein [Phycisphaerales bacterium]|nr:pentapeptide repeat-containing protein [Phycisphaerales bacterium]
MIHPERAVVRAMVRSAATGRTRPLDSAIAPLLRPGLQGRVAIVGGPGAGKTTALRHIASLVPVDAQVTLIDDVRTDRRSNRARSSTTDGVEFYACHVDAYARCDSDLDEFVLQPWDRDAWIEYLLAQHRQQCASVMQRLEACTDLADLNGSPAMTRPVLDAFAADTEATCVRTVLRKTLDDWLTDPEVRRLASAYALESIFVDHSGKFAAQPPMKLQRRAPSPVLIQWLRHACVRELLAVDQVMADLRSSAAPGYLDRRLCPSIVERLGAAIAADTVAMKRLKAIIASGSHGNLHASAVSLIVAASPTWRPNMRSPANLRRAHLVHAAWPDTFLTNAFLQEANLTGADLTEARLIGARLRRAVLRRAKMHRATMRHVHADNADFGDADLSFIGADGGSFESCGFRNTNLEGALFHRAILRDADLTNARLTRANLHGATLMLATIDGADFRGCCLIGADLTELDLTVAQFGGATFEKAFLLRSVLDHMELPSTDFSNANLFGASMSCALLSRANFRGADLRRTRLADIDLENADLRDADIRQATFHAGSSRSGLVGSPIACEGSRTGFYTDEYEEQGFQAPEAIRKANLRGADLRGAMIDETDFYLVDLRDAIYTAEQEVHLRACRAILETPV